MKNLMLFAALFTITVLFSCKDSCSNMPSSFSSYSDAYEVINNTSWKIDKSIRSINSSWVNSASYKSCDGELGYFIYQTNKGKSYTHSNVPIDIWYEFVDADSKGKFIRAKLKGRYRLSIR